MGMGSKKIAMQGTRPGARPEPEVFFTPFPLLPPVASPHHSTTSLLHSPRNSLQPLLSFSSVWSGGRRPLRESGPAERSECG